MDVRFCAFSGKEDFHFRLMANLEIQSSITHHTHKLTILQLVLRSFSSSLPPHQRAGRGETILSKKETYLLSPLVEVRKVLKNIS